MSPKITKFATMDIGKGEHRFEFSVWEHIDGGRELHIEQFTPRDRRSIHVDARDIEGFLAHVNEGARLLRQIKVVSKEGG